MNKPHAPRLLRFCRFSIAAVILALGQFAQLHAQTAFTYQGRLLDNAAPANGNYDFQFTLYNSSGTPVSAPITNTAVPITNGLFTTTLDFGAAPFTGIPVLLDIAARTNGSIPFNTLTPRQPITPTPAAIFASQAADALTLSGSVPANGLTGTYGQPINLTNNANNFSGNGAGLINVPGTLAPQLIPGTNIQATPNTAYILTNSQNVNVTLPANPNIGDTLRLVGAGTGGWTLAQNPGQTVIGQNLVNPLTTWRELFADNGLGRSLACSADGTHILATYAEYCDYSTDSGATWTFPATADLSNGEHAALSSDGHYIVAVAPNSQIVFSSDYGAHWAYQTNTVTTNYSSVAMSADGSHMVATVNGGGIYETTNYGAIWILTTAITNSWVAVATSTDGTRLAAASTSGNIYLSTGYGATWTPANVISQPWTALCCSADGTRLIAIGPATNAVFSIDAGQHWQTSNTGSGDFFAIACSADGLHIAASANNAITLSQDGGLTWSQSSAPPLNWRGIAASATGNFYANEIATGIWQLKISTSAGTNGYLTGGPNTAVELQYIGNGQFLPINHEGTLLTY
jgi:hypothetical protein